MTFTPSAQNAWPFEFSEPEIVLGDTYGGRWSDTVLVASALLSSALAETTIASGSLVSLRTGVFCYSFAFFALLGVYRWLSGLFVSPLAPWGRWIAAGAYVLFPVHLLLPAALIGQQMGSGGFALYGLVKLLLLAPIFRRALQAVGALNRWPPWSAALLLTGPFVLSTLLCLVLLLMVLLGIGFSLMGVLR